MTTLRQQFHRELVIRGMSPKTQDAYVRAVRDLALHYHKTPDLITDEEIKGYLFYLVQEKHLAPSSVNVAVSDMRCFYDLVLHRECEHLGRVLPRSLKAIRRPRFYSIEELERLFTIGCVHPKHRVFLMTVYGGGLRLGEACRLQPCHLDGARMQIRIEEGKGRKDRYTLLSPRLLEELRQYYRMFRPKEWIFFGRDQNQPMPSATGQKIFYLARERAGLPDKGGIHSLRQNAECREMPSEVNPTVRTLRDSCGLASLTRHFQRPCKNARSLSPGR